MSQLLPLLLEEARESARTEFPDPDVTPLLLVAMDRWLLPRHAQGSAPAPEHTLDEPQDAHMVYPISAHAMEHQADEDGGFVDIPLEYQRAGFVGAAVMAERSAVGHDQHATGCVKHGTLNPTAT